MAVFPIILGLIFLSFGQTTALNPSQGDELIINAQTLPVSFSHESLIRIKSLEILSNEQAVLSNHVIVFNETPRKYTITGESCQGGSFVSNAFPERILGLHSNTTYVIQGDGSGALAHCTVTYKAINGPSSFGIVTTASANPVERKSYPQLISPPNMIMSGSYAKGGIEYDFFTIQ